MYMPTLLYKLTISFLLLTAAQLISSEAMSQDTVIKEKDKEVVIKRKHGNDKITLVIDGNKVVLNGKDIINLDDLQINVEQVQRNAERSVRAMERSLHAMERNLEGTVAAIPPVPPVPPAFFEKLDKARLGVYTEKNEKGAKITQVMEDSPAQKAGLQKGDIIVSIGKSTVAGPASLSEIIGDMTAGDKVDLKYVRDKKQQKTSVILDSHPHKSQSLYFQDFGGNFAKSFKGFSENLGKPQLGIRIQDTEEGNGVKVLELDTESLAAKSGIEKDDLIIAIDGNTIKTTDDARRQLAAVKDKSLYVVRVLRGNSEKDIEIKIPKKLKTTNL